MDDKLKHLRSAMDETVFQDGEFTEEDKNRVREKIENPPRPLHYLRWFGSWFKPVLSVVVCLALFVGGVYIANQQGGKNEANHSASQRQDQGSHRHGEKPLNQENTHLDQKAVQHDNPKENKEQRFPYPNLLSDKKGKYSYLYVSKNGSSGAPLFSGEIEHLDRVISGWNGTDLKRAQKLYPKLKIHKAPYYIFFNTTEIALRTGNEKEAKQFIEKQLSFSENEKLSPREWVQEIVQKAGEGKIINSDFIAGQTDAKDVEKQWGKPNIKNETKTGTYMTYMQKQAAFGYHGDAPIFDIRSYDAGLNRIRLSDIEREMGKPDDVRYYHDRTHDQKILVYNLNDVYQLKWIVEKPSKKNPNPRVNHISVYDKKTAGS